MAKKVVQTVVETPTPARTGKYRGLGTVVGIPAGLRRMEFQDRLLAWNADPKNHFTDEELAAIMDAEHPGGVKIRPDHMRAIRRLYNAGRHTKLGVVPETASVAYSKTDREAALALSGKPVVRKSKVRKAAPVVETPAESEAAVA